MKKTIRKVAIIQHMHNRNDVINRCIYEDKNKQEFVVVNRCFIPLQNYKNSTFYEVLYF